MKEIKLTIQIQKPSSVVFAFTTDPKNTPSWIDSIVSEEVSESPVKLGTRYTNVDRAGVKNIYEVSKIIEGQLFELKSIPTGYTVRYTYRAISSTETELEYWEWVDEGDLPTPFQQENLDKLKAVIEAIV